MVEPTLDDLLDDEMMIWVMRSAGTDAAKLRANLAETARRLGLSRATRHEGCAALAC